MISAHHLTALLKSEVSHVTFQENAALVELKCRLVYAEKTQLLSCSEAIRSYTVSVQEMFKQICTYIYWLQESITVCCTCGLYKNNTYCLVQ